MSRVNTDGATPANPLGFMQRLSPSVTYYEPTTSTIAQGSRNAQADPELILLSTWMGARENHIAKYVQGYRVTFPTSRILVAQCPFTHVVLPFLAWTQIRPAVPILKEVVDSESRQASKDDASSVLTGTSTAPRVLIHAFSNGGVSTTLFLYNALKRSLGGTFSLPQHVFIFDSCPGTFRWRNTARAIMKILPRWSSPAVHAVLFSVWLFYRIVPVLQPRQNVNSRTIRNPRFQEFEVRRTYLYGTEDHMIPPTDVEYEAGLAAEAGFNVRLERFEDATHVAIPMLHPERYWRVVKESWHGEEPAGLTSVVVGGAGGDSGNLRAEISSETVTREIILVDQEKPISEEAGILAEDIKSDGRDAVQAVENTAHEVSKSAQSVAENAATKVEEAKQQSRDVAEKAQSKVGESKADAHTAIEQGQAKLKQLKANAAGAAKEIQIKANRKSLSKETNTFVEEVKADAANALEEAKDVPAKESEKSAVPSVPVSSKKPKEAAKAKDKYAERPKTPETSTALQAAIAAASSSPEATKASSPRSHGRSASGGASGVQELAARFGSKVDKGTAKLPKAKASQADHTKADEAMVVAKSAEQPPSEKQTSEKISAEEKPAEHKVAVEDTAKVEQPKPASNNKPKKSKKNGKK
ncbi:hypothetical protein LEL_03319 [Akanthomyces lecanii RCEF 1005]|uniref:Indole-diterpene biosynthesis protein PaxU n=1 Tax=Akanthomyces lecanii RCEF 1005 TaxID=1081108 RepID=A0A168IZ67_CORDF|nr:hypothetical protein LEL_03319 [Akanthomyces lecanii RCEF 1005]